MWTPWACFYIFNWLHCYVVESSFISLCCIWIQQYKQTMSTEAEQTKRQPLIVMATVCWFDIWRSNHSAERQLDFEYSSSSGQSKSSVESGKNLNQDAHKNPVQVEDVVDSNHFCSTHFALFSFVFRRVSPFVRLRIFRRSQWFTLGRCFRQSGIFYLEITHTYK